jgi:hypothetical protein
MSNKVKNIKCRTWIEGVSKEGAEGNMWNFRGVK